MIAVDASAMVAILQREDGFEALLDALKRTEKAVTSPLAIFEAVLAVRRILGCPTETANRLVLDFLSSAEIETIAIPADAAQEALTAFDRFGKGTGHSAKLNLGDCFAYAQASRLRAALLFRGDDSSRTDIEIAGRG